MSCEFSSLFVILVTVGEIMDLDSVTMCVYTVLHSTHPKILHSSVSKNPVDLSDSRTSSLSVITVE